MYDLLLGEVRLANTFVYYGLRNLYWLDALDLEVPLLSTMTFILLGEFYLTPGIGLPKPETFENPDIPEELDLADNMGLLFWILLALIEIFFGC